MLNLDVLIPTKEVATLLDADRLLVRSLVEKGQIQGFVTDKERRTFKIPRLAFYKQMGWYTDEEIKHAYKMAGLELKEKADFAESTQND